MIYGEDKKEYSCALLLTHDLIGGKWKMRILWHVINGDNRFSLLVKAIPDITQKVLGSQLKELEQSGILKRNVINDNPPRTIIYEIADEQKGLIPVVENLCKYTKDYAKGKSIKVPD